MTYYPGSNVKSPWQESYHGTVAAAKAGRATTTKHQARSLRKMCLFFSFMSPCTQALDDGAGKMMVVLYRSQGD